MNKSMKFFCLVLCVCILMGNSPLYFARAESAVIDISSLDEFLEFAENCRLDSFSEGKTFRLTMDIDLTDTDFNGIPIFCGTLEGGGHRISGLKITSPGSAKGLFRYLESTATVRDLKVEGTIVPTGTRSQVGGIAGSNAGVIENCSFNGTIIGADQVGGIVGSNLPGGVVRSCSTDGIVSGKHFAGGITGSNDGSIQNCENQADVNTTAQQNDITISDITLDNLLNIESAAATTDIGGIAGISSGMILSCVNRGDVGYPHMGYNVGGITGLQTGYVADCENYGTVSGRKEVGGIAGQQEPQVVLNYNTDTLQILQSQISVLSDLVNRAVINGNSNATHIQNLLYKLERHVLDARDASDYLNDSLTDLRFEDLQSYTDAIETIRDSIVGITSTLRSLWDATDDTMTDLDEDMKAISDQIAQIESTLNDAESNLGGQIFDISDQDTEDQLGSKLENCHNFGNVSADWNVGGILGAVSFENDLDPEEDITIVGETTLNAIGSLRSVIRNCGNSGQVSTKYQRVGGIVGWLTMGLINNCVNTGTVGSEAADYAGGIVGDCRGFIRNCKVKSTIYGDSNIGGIAGCGSIASGCYAMVSLAGAERLGGIFGEAVQSYHELESAIEKNYYYIHGADLGGIDGISYEEKAKGLSLEIFLILQEDESIFHRVSVTFLADGEVIEQVTLPTGSALQNVPDVPQKAGCVGSWIGLSEANLNELVFDLVIQAEYTPYTTTIQSQEVSEAGRPILLLQGDFEVNAALYVNRLESIAGLGKDQLLLQCWEFATENCVALHSGRFLLPQGSNADKLILLIQDANGNWVQRTFRVDESYLVFSLSNGDRAIALVEQESSSLFTPGVLIAAGAGVITLLVIVLILSKIRKRKAKQAQTSET